LQPETEKEGLLFETRGAFVSWELLSSEQKQAVKLGRVANEGLEQFLDAAAGDAAELRQVGASV
jgi:hypothetical protein